VIDAVVRDAIVEDEGIPVSVCAWPHAPGRFSSSLGAAVLWLVLSDPLAIIEDAFEQKADTVPPENLVALYFTTGGITQSSFS